ncbi:MAG: c-type cytochrome [Gemmatimonadetes bacterium]|uniref:C-type cytochrome n=1 Tax=Candidatus Kutchimonas denitrificans TaxID=3056748 RepID=A0AAE5CCQ3_9BACT|nr:c-type cytochrome [Gemmatimonadota bacterium]NIR76263.1 c-type cytochrome [Candidatus Kutchimonas denitrificans]NIS02286.1 c-type cytochrome [Gemmatimonadota bacterium]NIT68105.1 c-type cytochrome [Gemmatimonadota bacterium]NIU54329.1 c-type cytochrome [Gemmatimonadota bacterium]
MFMTNLKIAIVVVLTVAGYTLIANMIPQIESEVPEELALSADASAAELVAAGERIFGGAGGCTACHGLGTRAPNLTRSTDGLGPIGARCGDRVPDQDCKTYLYTSLTDPGSYVVDGYNPIMPDADRTLPEDQIWALVAFLQAQGGVVTVTADDLVGASSAATAASAAPAAAATAPSTRDPRQLLNEFGCLACHQLDGQGTAIGPAFTDVGARLDAAAIRESILDPRVEVSAGYEAFANLMPTDFGERMTAAQLEALVDFLAQQR